MVGGLVLVELGVDWRLGLEGESMSGSDTVSTEDLGNEAALLSWAIVDRDLTSLYRGYIVAVAEVYSGTGAKDRQQCL